MVLRVGGGRILSNATILKLPGRHVLVYVRAGEDVGWRLSQIEGALTRNRRPIHRLRGDFTQLKENINLVVTFGGDGTFLQAASLFPHEAPTFLPISGGTLGFMLPWGRFVIFG